MTKQLFVDTGAWIALADKTDEHHARAVEIQDGLRRRKARLVTSDYVVDETLTWLRYKAGHRAATIFGSAVFESKVLDVTAIDRAALADAWVIFRKFSDQRFSFTDCTSFALMKTQRISRAFTFDDHFNVMGFRLEEP